MEMPASEEGEEAIVVAYAQPKRVPEPAFRESVQRGSKPVKG